jgi:hypothetical protein
LTMLMFISSVYFDSAVPIKVAYLSRDVPCSKNDLARNNQALRLTWYLSYIH